MNNTQIGAGEPLVRASQDPIQGPVEWRLTQEAPPLAPDDLHLWRIHADGDGQGSGPLADLDVCLGLLGQGQRARAAAMTHASYRARYVRSQAGLRRILGLYLDRPPQALVFVYGPAGKPGLDGAHPHPSGLTLEFNLTTTRDLALVGVRLGQALGVDCEWMRPRTGIEGIARRMLDPRLADALAALPQEDRLHAFYRAWTALEADAKADGRGLFRPRDPGARRPQIRHFLPAAGYIAAVAGDRLPHPERWQTWQLSGR